MGVSGEKVEFQGLLGGEVTEERGSGPWGTQTCLTLMEGTVGLLQKLAHGEVGTLNVEEERWATAGQWVTPGHEAQFPL